MQNRYSTVILAALCAVYLTGCLGCAGTSPQFTPPQMQNQTLPQPNVGRGKAGRSGAANAPTLAAEEAVNTPEGTFIAPPYLQLGGDPGKLVLQWTAPLDQEPPKPQTGAVRPARPALAKAGKASGKPVTTASASDPSDPSAPPWQVELRAGAGADWQKVEAPLTERKIAPDGVKGERLFQISLPAAAGGFVYRVLHYGKPVFAAAARTPGPADQLSRFVVLGDCGDGSKAQKQIAYQISQAKPDMVLITGDIVYAEGRVSEYRTNFWPIFNADRPAPSSGAPLLRSVPFAAAPGNHDLVYSNLGKHPDGLAYYYYWSVPANGPELAAGSRNTPPIRGSESAKKALASAAGAGYPGAASYSFDAGAVHWLVLDSNYYMDWTDPQLRAWVEKDLADSRAPWKFVLTHVAPFHSSEKHQEEQYLRVLSDVFEKNGVDIVWAGHVHNYQRSHPLKFTAVRNPAGLWRDPEGRVAGEWTLDKVFDGKTNTRPGGPIYVVSGAGGASLYDRALAAKPERWQEFTAKYIADHSFSVIEVEGTRLTVRQLSGSGKELDRFTLTK